MPDQKRIPIGVSGALSKSNRHAVPALVPQPMVSPPSITSVCPVMNRPAAPERQTTIPATSSTSPKRRSGVRVSICALVRGSSHSALEKSVLITPGARQLIRTLWGPSSTARFRTSCMSAAWKSHRSQSLPSRAGQQSVETTTMTPSLALPHVWGHHLYEPVVRNQVVVQNLVELLVADALHRSKIGIGCGVADQKGDRAQFGASPVDERLKLDPRGNVGRNRNGRPRTVSLVDGLGHRGTRIWFARKSRRERHVPRGARRSPCRCLARIP